MSRKTGQADGSHAGIPRDGQVRLVTHDGETARALVDPATNQITHVVVEDLNNLAGVRTVQNSLGIAGQAPAVDSQAAPLRIGDEVDTAQGWLGRVDSFLVDAQDGRVTHMVLYENQLFGQTVVPVPITAIDQVDQGAVHLKLSTAEVESLPIIPLDHWQPRLPGKPGA